MPRSPCGPRDAERRGDRGRRPGRRRALTEPMTATRAGWWAWRRPPSTAAHPPRLRVPPRRRGAAPDPRSAWQPHGVHGASRTFDAARTSGGTAPGPARSRALGTLGGVVYELHVGTFTPEGTLDAAVGRLDHLVELGVDVVELMPVAAFDGTLAGATTASARMPCTTPTAARPPCSASSTRATPAASGVCLDVVYNHLGPGGQLPVELRPLLHRRPPHALGAGRQPRPGRQRPGAPLDRRQRPALVRATSTSTRCGSTPCTSCATTPSGTCSPSCPTRSPRSRRASAGR